MEQLWNKPDNKKTVSNVSTISNQAGAESRLSRHNVRTVILIIPKMANSFRFVFSFVEVNEQNTMENCVTVTVREGKSHLSRLYSTYPVRIIHQERWLRHISLVLLGFGGGLLGGDRNDLDITLGPQAQLR